MNLNKPVADLMTKKLVTVVPEDSIIRVEQLFNENSFHHLPVVDANGILSGIISKEDWLACSRMIVHEASGRVWAQKKTESLMAKDIMTAFPMHLAPDDSVSVVVDIFLENKYHSLPIVDDDGRLLGLLTSFDLLKYGFSGAVIE